MDEQYWKDLERARKAGWNLPSLCSSTNTEAEGPLHYEMSRAVYLRGPRRCDYCHTLNDGYGDKRGNCIACGAPLPEERNEYRDTLGDLAYFAQEVARRIG